MIVLMRVRMSIICSENGLLVCSHGPLELAQSVNEYPIARIPNEKGFLERERGTNLG